jgi:hypothetical protein
MADNTNTTTADQGQGAQPQVQDNGKVKKSKKDTTPAKLYATKAEAQADKPANAPENLRPFEVMHNGISKGWVLARWTAHAIEQVARLDGYSASVGGGKEVTKDMVAAKLALFTDAELEAMGLSRKPTQPQPTGKGKKS